MELVYEQQWSSYEDWGGIEIYEDAAGDFHVREGGYSSVWSLHSDPIWEETEPADFVEVIDLIDKWEAIAKENEKEMCWEPNHWG